MSTFFVDIELVRVNNTNDIQNSTPLDIFFLEKNRCKWRRLQIIFEYAQFSHDWFATHTHTCVHSNVAERLI